MSFLPAASYYMIRATEARLRNVEDVTPPDPLDTRALIFERKHGVDLFAWLAMLREIRELPQAARSTSTGG